MSKLCQCTLWLDPSLYKYTHIYACINFSLSEHPDSDAFLLEWPGSSSSRLLKICEVDFQSIQYFMFSFTFSFIYFFTLSSIQGWTTFYMPAAWAVCHLQRWNLAVGECVFVFVCVYFMFAVCLLRKNYHHCILLRGTLLQEHAQ